MAESKRDKSSVSEIIVPGQRWVSDMEPELGLGKILQVDHRRITIEFHDGETVRIYTKENSPLRRIIFKSGDTIQTVDGDSLHIKSISDQNGIVFYNTEKELISETDLSSINKISAPMDRLISSHVDSIHDFRLRIRLLDLQYRISESPVRGYVGGRIDLIPHQLYIANEISSRFVRRVMLADEVGLGKTIEACMILHRLIVSGRVSQVLIIVPESMVHVWFVELLRKFNLLFSIVDNGEELSGNPFSESSLILIGMNLFQKNQQLVNKALEINWDMIIVDEAHHIAKGNDEFTIVEALSKKTKDLFFLTATPQHFGEENHFERLRLLDPLRYNNFEEHCKEALEHKKIADVTGKILDGTPLSKVDISQLTQLLQYENMDVLIDSNKLTESERKQIVAEIIDRQGIGRALFRNTRMVIGGFPKRNVTIEYLQCKKIQKDYSISVLKEDINNETPHKKRTFHDDPRVDFLAGLLREKNEEKFLIICRSKYSALALDEALQKVINVKTALFHEDLTLLQRDRNAAWFSEEDGARILICSEIGSEGRNFQFAHNLFFFDLPISPELVEQRIGRLDRIGQKDTINLHIAVLADTPEAFLAQWYHEGAGIFTSTVPAAQEAFEDFENDIQKILLIKDSGEFNLNSNEMQTIIGKTKVAIQKISDRLQCGRNRLLEQHSFRPKEAEKLVESINTLDKDQSLKLIMKDLLRSRGILTEEFNNDTWNLLSESQLDESFPGLNSSRSIITFDRNKALHREDYEFITIDHPAVTGGIDLFLSSEMGNASFAIKKDNNITELFMETYFVADCVAPSSLYISRFLPKNVIRIIIDNKGIDRTESIRFPDELLEDVKTIPLMERLDVKQKLLPSMLKNCQNFASKKCDTIIKHALEKVKIVAGSEIDRLKALKKINPSVSDQEIDIAQNEYSQLLSVLSKTTVRLEAIRLIWCPSKPKN